MSGPVDLDVSPAGMLVTDRVAVVTGAAQGIGEACAVGLARFGAHVAVCDRNAEGLAATVADVEALGRRAVSGELDVRDPDAVDAFLSTVEAEYGHVDILVNNAGGTFFSPFLDVSGRGEAALIAENFTQVSHFIRRTVPLMGERGGSIVNVTSIEAHRAGPGFAVYSAMKAAVENLTKSLALELADRRIRVNCIAPDMIPTPGDEGLVHRRRGGRAGLVEDRPTRHGPPRRLRCGGGLPGLGLRPLPHRLHPAPRLRQPRQRRLEAPPERPLHPVDPPARADHRPAETRAADRATRGQLRLVPNRRAPDDRRLDPKPQWLCHLPWPDEGFRPGY